AAAGRQLLPPIMLGDGYTTAMVAAHIPVLLLCIAAVAVLGSRRPYTILDLWLIVVVLAWMFGGARSPVLYAGRFDIGFYTGRLYGLLAASLVPIILLVEASRLYGRLDQALAVAAERNTELARSREELAQAKARPASAGERNRSPTRAPLAAGPTLPNEAAIETRTTTAVNDWAKGIAKPVAVNNRHSATR